MSQVAKQCITTGLVRLPRYLQHGINLLFTWLKNNWQPGWQIVDVGSLLAVDVLRLFTGGVVASNLDKCARPKKPILLYEYEACPFCKKVREALSVLDIDHIVYPCPRETLKAYGVCEKSRYRGVPKSAGGACMFPYIEDANTEVKMNNSDDIIEYLFSRYGSEAVAPLNYRIVNFPLIKYSSLLFVSFCRPLMDMGVLRIQSHKPNKPLELWGYESNPFVKRVREALSSMELHYVMHVIPFGSSKRQKFLEDESEKMPKWRKRLGLINVPFFKDPNTGVEMFDSEKIVRYLNEKYCNGEPPDETWLDFACPSKLPVAAGVNRN